ncbi:5-amino-6-(5-phosphoribosylamino)uracil reductase [Stackebrandtia endophytica]|uniref:5-amino-6-(5-phosphoribosylamino)uracil reductase n=1 Tax=Stackebrandtia endophytica TaxID=1496996 RepID=A0A543AXG1_9ACTN|nr:dihydrofolate reductase family protein [Stackebrandtia endophytica]TQL77264.1 5-amino-6-(5-phosphoribosylamino)uracil reductase [Stackebrandtia endophytica]
MKDVTRPYVLLSAATSIDGYLDDASNERLLLSNEIDFDRVDAERAGSDAIMIGAGTIRADNPRLVVRSALRRRERLDAGRSADPIKVTVTGSGDLDPNAAFFTVGGADRLVYAKTAAVSALTDRLGDRADVIDAGAPVQLAKVLADLVARGVERLMVEGGGRLHTQLLAAGFVDELHLVIAPFLIGDSTAPRFVTDGRFPFTPANPLRLAETRQMDNVVLLRYLAIR